MRGDIIEIVMAALRGYRYFEGIIPDIVHATGKRLPQVFDSFCQFVRLVHYLDAFFCTGKVRFKSAPVPLLCHRWPEAAEHPDAILWRSRSWTDRQNGFFNIVVSSP